MQVERARSTSFEMKHPRRWRWITALVAIPLVLYSLAFAFFAVAMRRPPEQFARVMSNLSPVPFLIFPFETMWIQARRGSLKVGDQAPDFNLPLLGQSETVRLSSFRNSRPVVLVFGSYT